MNLKKILTVAGLTILLCSSNLYLKSDEKKCPKRKAVKVEVTKITGQGFLEYKDFQVKVYPKIIVIKAVVSGKVSDVKVSEGDFISKGLEMLVIDDALASEIKSLESEIKKLEKRLFQRRHWKVRNERAEKQTERQVKKAEAKLEGRKAQVSNYIIKAPTEGKIKSLKVSKDIEISADEIVAEIEIPRKMLAEIPISDEDKSLFSKGQEIEVEFKDIGGKFNAVVIKVSEKKVILAVKNRIKLIKENFSLKFKLIKKEYKDAVVIANNKILNDETGNFVYKVEGKYAKRADLKIGAVTGEKSLVSEGLSVGDEIIVAEILSAKEGTVKEEFECLKDNVKIKVLQKDPEIGKFVKRKAIKKVKKIKEKEVKEEKDVKIEKPEKEKEIVKKPAENIFTAGLGSGIIFVNQSGWADVYSKGNLGFAVKIAYQIKRNYELFAEFNYMKAKGELIPVSDETTSTFTPFYFGAKYLFNIDEKFTPFLGLAGIMGSVKEVNDYATIKENSFGISILAGTYFSINDKMGVELCFKYDNLKFSIENSDEKANMSGARLFLLFSYKFSKFALGGK